MRPTSEGAGNGPELDTVADPAAFGTALRRLREHRGLSLRTAERHLGELTDRAQDRWSKSKIEEAEKGKRLEERWVLRYLSAMGVPGPDLPPWVMALRRALDPSPTRPGPPASNLGPRNRVFTGRDEVLATLRERLRSDGVGVEAVYGLGGVGKTELAREFAHRYAGDYELIWWIPAERPAIAAATLAALAGPLGLPGAASQSEAVAAVLAALRTRERWLLVFDNAEHPDALAGLVPTLGTGHVLVTSRWPAWTETAHPAGLAEFDRAESMRYLAERLDGAPAPDVLDALAELLGDLPLALAEAAAYLEDTRIGPEAYLGLLRERARELFGPGPHGDADHDRVATVWSLSLERVHAQAPAAEALLTLLAYLGPDDVPRSLAPAYAEVLPADLAAVVGDPLRYNHALAVLHRYSMITLGPDAVGVHRLVQAVVRARLDPAAEAGWATTATALLDAAFPDDPREPATCTACARLLPHALAAAEHAERLQIALAEAGQLLSRESRYLRERGQYRLALRSARRALADTAAARNPGHPEVAQRHVELGSAHYELGELDAARAGCLEGLRIGVTALGPDHPDVGRWRTQLGMVLWRLGEATAARRECEESLRVLRTALGSSHPEVGAARGGLALALRELGDLKDSRREADEALRISLAALGPDHPKIGRWRNTLGRVLWRLGETTEARQECAEAVRIGVAALGAEHPDVGVARVGLGLALRELGEPAAARREADEALRIGLAALGPDHPQTQQARALRDDLAAESQRLR